MRVEKHPILDFSGRKEIEFSFNGKPLIGYEGDTIASALVANDIMHFSNSVKLNRPRGFYCAIGNCGSCNMKVNGVDNVKTCMTLLKPNMIVESEMDEVFIND